MSGQERVLLKILSGSQFGVEIALEDGTYSFGSGDDADLAFADHTLAQHHGHLRIGSGKIEIKANGGDLRAASGLSLEKGDEGWHEIAQLDAITAGTTRFALGSPKAAWARLLKEAEAGTAPTAPPVPRVHRGRALAAPVGVAGLAALFLFGSGIIGGDGASGRVGAFDGASSQMSNNVREALADLPFAHRLAVTVADDGRITVEGYVDDVVQRRAVRQALATTDAAVAPRVWALDTLRADVKGLLEARGADLEFRVGTDGSAVLTGTMLDGARVERIAQLLRDEVFGLSGVSEEVRSAEDILVEVQELADDLRLRDLVMLRVDGAIIEATGTVPGGKLDNWVGFVTGYAKAFAAEIPLRSFVTIEGRAPQTPVVISLVPGGAALAWSEGEQVLGEEILSNRNALTAAVTGGAAPLPDLSGTAPALDDPEVTAALATRLRDVFTDNPVRVAEVLGLPTDAASLERLGSVIARAVEDPALLARIAKQVDEAAVQELLRFVLDDSGSSDSIAGNGTVQADAETGSDTTRNDPTGDGRAVSGGGTAPAFLRFVMGNAATELETAAAALPLSHAGPEAFAAAPSDPAAPFVEGAPGDPGAPRTFSGPDTGADAVPDAPVVVPVADAAADALDGAAKTPASAGGTANTRSDRAEPTKLPSFVGLPAERTFAPPFRRLVQATELALAAADGGVGDLPGGLRAPAAVSLLSEGLLEAVRSQQEALRFGRTLLHANAGEGDADGGACWPGAAARLDQLPTILFWIDYFSVDPDVDLAQVDGPNRLLFYEVAMSPLRVRACLERLDSPLAKRLLRESVFLRETAVNRRFAGYLFRNVPRYGLDLAGVDLTGDRYVELRDGRRLTAGMAPDLDSRLAVIGDLGVILRVPSGYSASLLDDGIGWVVQDL